jgi:MiaB-like tRNA modifying enzyme
MAGLLSKSGFGMTKNLEEADIIIVNTCVVKSPTEQKILHRIGYLQKKFPRKKIIIAGCMPELLGRKLKQLSPKTSLISTHHVKEIVKVAEKSAKGLRSEILGKSNNVKICSGKLKSNPLISIVPIASGCKSACSYCCVKIVKGDLFSYPEGMILNEMRSGLRSGSREIWLTSQDCGCYGFDKENNIAELLRKSVKIPGDFFIRVGMMNPRHIDKIIDDLLKAYKSPKVYKFAHIPVQSGSDHVLRMMRRGYDIKTFKKIIRRFRNEFHEIIISTDIIVGFPGETDADFKKTISLLKWLKPDIVNVSKFGSRPFTAAEKMKKVEEKTVKARSKITSDLSKRLSHEANRKWLGWKGEILVTENGRFAGQYIGRNFGYKPVLVESKKNLLGKHVNVKITSAEKTYLRGKICF